MPTCIFCWIPAYLEFCFQAVLLMFDQTSDLFSNDKINRGSNTGFPQALEIIGNLETKSFMHEKIMEFEKNP